jgi:hypothetical protein
MRSSWSDPTRQLRRWGAAEPTGCPALQKETHPHHDGHSGGQEGLGRHQLARVAAPPFESRGMYQPPKQRPSPVCPHLQLEEAVRGSGSSTGTQPSLQQQQQQHPTQTARWRSGFGYDSHCRSDCFYQRLSLLLSLSLFW